ncbi:hypothetical protein OG21DRAFT_593970 [Imleria badia]|nr:hypothetical protein OG21DRAFT_593970 [Imleria badia]
MSLLARLHAIQSFDAPLSGFVPPIIPSDIKEPLPGLRFLRDEVKRDCDLLQQHANSSANAPYLIAVWDELVQARQPVAIYRTFSAATQRAVKVDVVAENGARWVRVNTIKNARLMMEFREVDSYLTSDDEDTGPRLAQTEFDNSVLRMGRELLAAAKANPISIPAPSVTATVTPQVTMRLTRLDSLNHDTPDPRIEKTIQCLRDMGIDVQLGERSFPAPILESPPKPERLEPTTNINLDLSALIALISDISHSPLPRTEHEANARFEPPQSYLDWKRDRIRQNQRLYDVEDGEGDASTWENSGQHSRALAAQAIQEMNKGILDEIHERISPVITTVTFWTTSEARHRCLQIVSKIGGERERKRADALLGSTLCTRTPPVPAPVTAKTAGMDDAGGKTSADTFWEDSRYPAGFLPLVPVRVYPSILPAVEDASRQSSTFFDALARTCTGILPHEAVPIPQSSSPSDTSLQVLEEKQIPPAAPTSLPKLTVHTVSSTLAGASRGYTTLTTNRSSVKAMLKEMRRGGCYEPEVREVDKAALWILDPRSLSEGMRSE